MLNSRNKNNSTEVSAKNINDAIEQALKELGVTRDEADIEILEEGSKGFFGIGSKDAVVRATVKTPAPQPEEKKAAKQSGKKPAKQSAKASAKAPADKAPAKASDKQADKAPDKPAQKKTRKTEVLPDDELVKAAEDFLNKLFDAMNIDVGVSAAIDGDIMNIDLKGDNMGIIIGKRGDTLDSLQYLTSLVVNQKTANFVKVTIDTENYREKRAEALVSLSARLAAKVAKTGRKFTLEPMNPYERRIIHSNLQSNPDVTTFSVGSEPYRKVVIAPKNPRRYDRRTSSKRSGSRSYDRRSSDKSETVTAKKTGNYTTTYKADFKATPHKAEYKSYEEYLEAQHGEILPPINKLPEDEEI